MSESEDEWASEASETDEGELSDDAVCFPRWNFKLIIYTASRAAGGWAAEGSGGEACCASEGTSSIEGFQISPPLLIMRRLLSLIRYLSSNSHRHSLGWRHSWSAQPWTQPWSPRRTSNVKMPCKRPLHYVFTAHMYL
jgi:hypothetical protein